MVGINNYCKGITSIDASDNRGSLKQVHCQQNAYILIIYAITHITYTVPCSLGCDTIYDAETERLLVSPFRLPTLMKISVLLRYYCSCIYKARR